VISALREDTELQPGTRHGTVLSFDQKDVAMTRSLVLNIIGYALLSFVLASIFHFVFSEVLPYAAGEHDALPWSRTIAFLTKASAWPWAELAAISVIGLAACLWNRSTKAPTRSWQDQE
jgi:hypothetical protein